MSIIGFTGKAGSGKDTCADYLVAKYGFVKLSWASPLKAGLAAMGFPEPCDRADKERVIPGFDFTWRQAAQTLGTEWGRALDANIWVKVAERIIAAAPAGTNFVISDVRFENESAMIYSLRGTVVHLEGRQADLGALAGHVSEAVLPIRLDSYTLVNSGSIEELYSDLDHLVEVFA